MQIALNFFSQFKKYGMWHYTIGSKNCRRIDRDMERVSEGQ